MKAKIDKVIPYVISWYFTNSKTCTIVIEKYNSTTNHIDDKVELPYPSFLDRMLKLKFEEYTAVDIVAVTDDDIFIRAGAYSSSDGVDVSDIDFAMAPKTLKFRLLINDKELRKAFREAIYSKKKYKNITITTCKEN